MLVFRMPHKPHAGKRAFGCGTAVLPSLHCGNETFQELRSDVFRSAKQMHSLVCEVPAFLTRVAIGLFFHCASS